MKKIKLLLALIKRCVKAFYYASLRPVCNGCPLYSICTSKYKEKRDKKTEYYFSKKERNRNVKTKRNT